MLTLLFALAVIVMTAAILTFVAAGARGEVDLEFQSGQPPSALPILLGGMLLMGLQVGIWVAWTLKYVGVW